MTRHLAEMTTFGAYCLFFFFFFNNLQHPFFQHFNPLPKKKKSYFSFFISNIWNFLKKFIYFFSWRINALQNFVGFCWTSTWISLPGCKSPLSPVKSLCAVLSHSTTFCDPKDVARQAPLSMGFSRQEYWSGLPCSPPEDLPNPGIKPRSPTLQVDSLLSEPPGKPLTPIWKKLIYRHSFYHLNNYLAFSVFP